MPANGTPELDLLQTLHQAAEFARMGIAISFGISFVLGGLVMLWRAAENPQAELAAKGARLFFLVGTVLLVAFCTLAVISPSEGTETWVIAGISFVLAVISITLDRGPQGLPALSFLSGAFIWLANIAIPFFFPTGSGAPRTFSWLSGLHISTAILGEGLFVVAFCGSLLYLWDHRRLKSGVLEKNPFLPSLGTLDKIIERASLSGLFLITTSLVSGLALVSGGRSHTQVGTTKIVWAFCVWGWYVFTIFGRGFWGWRGRRGATLSLWGTILLLLALFGTIWERV